MLELRYRSPLEGNDDSDDDLADDDDDDEEFIPNVGLVSSRHRHTSDSDQESGNALISLEQNIAKLEQSILANNHNNGSSMSANHGPHVTFEGGANNGSSSNMRRSSSVNDSSYDGSAKFFQKKKRAFNFPNVKKK